MEERYNLGEGSVQPRTVEVPWHGGCLRSLRDLGMRGLLGEGVSMASGTKCNARPLAVTHMRMARLTGGRLSMMSASAVSPHEKLPHQRHLVAGQSLELLSAGELSGCVTVFSAPKKETSSGFKLESRRCRAAKAVCSPVTRSVPAFVSTVLFADNSATAASCLCQPQRLPAALTLACFPSHESLLLARGLCSGAGRAWGREPLLATAASGCLGRQTFLRSK